MLMIRKLADLEMTQQAINSIEAINNVVHAVMCIFPSLKHRWFTSPCGWIWGGLEWHCDGSADGQSAFK